MSCSISHVLCQTLQLVFAYERGVGRPIEVGLPLCHDENHRYPNLEEWRTLMFCKHCNGFLVALSTEVVSALPVAFL
eukprot:6461034-Amphidinium_carterae.1